MKTIKITKELLAKEYKQYGITHVANKYNVSKPTIYNLLRNAKIPINNKVTNKIQLVD
tara:strand:+ start:1366 stop:1539 length:174 start_codon:yes stop_codon:yes gene_type:complete